MRITDPDLQSPLPAAGPKAAAQSGASSSTADYVNGTPSPLPQLALRLAPLGLIDGTARTTTNSAIPLSDPSDILIVPLTSSNYVAPPSIDNANYHPFEDDSAPVSDLVTDPAILVSPLQAIAPRNAGDSLENPAVGLGDPVLASVPEAATLTLLAIGLATLIASKRVFQARG